MHKGCTAETSDSSSGVCFFAARTDIKDMAGPGWGTVSPVCADPKDPKDPKDPTEKLERVDDLSHRSTEPAVDAGVDGREGSTNKVSEI